MRGTFWFMVVMLFVAACVLIYAERSNWRDKKKARVDYKEIQPLFSSSNFVAGGKIPIAFPFATLLKVKKVKVSVGFGISVNLWGDLVFQAPEGTRFGDVKRYTNSYATRYIIYTEPRVSMTLINNDGSGSEALDLDISEAKVDKGRLGGVDLKIFEKVHVEIDVDRVFTK